MAQNQTPSSKENELLEGLDSHTAHADEVAEPLPSELAPEQLSRGSVERYDGPFEPLAEWEYSDALVPAQYYRE
jgi:antitoxin VapB